MGKFFLVLSYKFLLVWLATSVATLAVLGGVFSYLLAGQHEVAAKRALTSSFKQASSLFLLRSDSISTLVDGLSNDAKIFNIVNLLHNYQDKENYRPLLFDNEKKSLMNLLIEQRSLTDHSFLAVYMTGGELVTYVQRDDQHFQASGYVSYVNKKPHIVQPSEDPDAIPTPFPAIGREIAPSVLPEGKEHHYSIVNGSLVHISSAPIIRDPFSAKRKVIGTVVAADIINELFLKQVTQLVGYPTTLTLPGMVSDNEFGFALDGITETVPDLVATTGEFSLVSNDDYFLGVSSVNLSEEAPAMMLIGVNKDAFTSGIGTLQRSILWTLVLTAFTILPIGAYFIRRNLTEPINKLMTGVKSLSTSGEPARIELHTHDELGALAMTFNRMARTIYNRESDLEHSRDQIRLITDNLPILLTYIDNMGRYRFANKTCCKWYNRPANQIIGSRSIDMHNDEYKHFKEHMQQGYAGIQTIFESRVKYPDGTTRDIRSGIIPDFDEHHQVRGVFSFSEDITEAKSIEEKYRQSQKTEAIGHFAGGIAHDFNNLLTIILGNLKWVSESALEGKMDPSVKEALDDALSAANDGAALTGDLLSFSRKRPLRNEVLDTQEAILSCVRLLSRLIPENISVVVNIEEQPRSFINIDKPQLDNAIMNLALNAKDAMTSGGVLEIGHQANPSLSDIPDAAPGTEYIAITVSDTGHGMSDKLIAAAPDPFFTTKPAGRGTGLGLSSVHGFVAQSNGKIKMESTIGIGTTVSLYFPKQPFAGIPRPISASPGQHPEAEATDSLAALAHGKAMLIAEDEEGVRKILARHFTNLGFIVHVVTNADEALKYVKNNHVDIVLTDIMMPGRFKGTHLARQVREHDADIKVILLTGYSNQEVLAEKLEETPLIQKPFEIKNLEDEVFAQLILTT